MNIDPLSTSSHLYRAKINSQEAEQKASARANDPAEADRLSTDLSSKVRARLAALPEVRPEVVERGRQLLADPSYPSKDIVRQIAGLITPLPEE